MRRPPSASSRVPRPTTHLGWWLSFLVAALLAGCAHEPPSDFAPDPALVERIRAIRIEAPARACPGARIRARYSAILEEGHLIPFATKYDPETPPPLHVVLLDLRSEDAKVQKNGDWVVASDPLASAQHGFRLHAALEAKPSLEAHLVVAPEYSCMKREFVYEGLDGLVGQPGFDGPDIVVRVGLLRSPFYERLLVARVELGGSHHTVLAEADRVPPADWILVESRGGAGGQGVHGQPGKQGAKGRKGCPGSAGAPGGPGGDGGPGGRGGRGGRIQVIVPQEQPLLAGLVDARSFGGPGGPGGHGGPGGRGGVGGAGVVPWHLIDLGIYTSCRDGADGPDGHFGRHGPPGPPGSAGSRPTITTMAARRVWLSAPRIGELLEYDQGSR